MAYPVWNSGVTLHEICALEIVQRTAVAIMRGEAHTNYQAALEYFQLKTLEERRKDICLKFAIADLQISKSPIGQTQKSGEAL